MSGPARFAAVTWHLHVWHAMMAVLRACASAPLTTMKGGSSVARPLSLLSGSASPLAIVGAGLFWLWVDAAVFSATLLGDAPAGTSYEMSFLAVTLASVVVLGALAIRPPMAGGLFSRGRHVMAAVAAVLGALGGTTLMLAAPGVHLAPLVIGSLCMGACFGCLNFAWGCVAVAQGHERAVVHIAGAWALGLPCNLLLYALPAVASGWAVAVLPLLSAGAFWALGACQSAGRPRLLVEERVLEEASAPRPRGMLAGVDARLVALILTFCAVFGLMYFYRILSPELAQSGANIEVVSVRGLTALVFFVAGLTVFRSRVRLLFKTCSYALIVGLAVMVVGLFVPSFYALSGVMIAVGYCGFDVLVWTMIAFHGYLAGNRMPRTVAVAMLAEQVGIGVGAVLGTVMASLAWGPSIETGVMMGLNVLSVGVLVGFTEYGSRMWALLVSVTSGGRGAGTGVNVTTNLDAAKLVGDGIVAAGQADRGASRDLVSEFAERYQLTEREREILAVFAQGRSMSYIADKLCVSENTIRTHVRHIYTKCGAHNKQELLDLVEAGR